MKKLGLIALAIVLALGVMGVGFAYWTDVLTGNGNVKMGSMSVIFLNTPTYTESNAIGQGSATVSVDGKTATVKVLNAYPGYNSTAVFTVKNNSTIPVNGVIVADDGVVFSHTNGVFTNFAVNASQPFTVNVVIPASWTANMGNTYLATYTLTANQFNAP